MYYVQDAREASEIPFVAILIHFSFEENIKTR